MRRIADFAERARDLRGLRSIILTTLFAALVVWGAAHHEPWRDEVVPLSMARHARSLVELAAPLRFEGHPVLWYAVLWSGYQVVGQTWILKVASVGSAIGAIFLLSRSPIAWWLQGLFTFSFFPLYQYSVISRGYSLEMLLLFMFCALHRHRRAHPVTVALVLAALANTEAFGLIMALAAAAMFVAEALMVGRGWRSLVRNGWLMCAIAVYLSGLALATLTALPDPGHRLTGFERLDLWTIAAGVGRAIAWPAAHSASLAVLPAASLFVWGYFVYLMRRPPVLCFAAIALIGIEILFNVVYGPRAPWHIGNVVLVLVAAMWLDASEFIAGFALPLRLDRARIWLGRALAIGVATAFAGQVVLGAEELMADVRYDYSANRRLAELLRSDPALTTAVVMGEPDPPLWSLPYYADNRIYLAREDVFRPWGIFANTRPVSYDLGALLRAARRVHAQCGCPVVITLGWQLGQPGLYTNFRGTQFEETFLITAGDSAEFVAATRPLARLGPTITDENYDVYLLR